MINELTLKVRPSLQYNLFSSKANFKETFSIFKYFSSLLKLVLSECLQKFLSRPKLKIYDLVAPLHYVTRNEYAC